MTRPPTNLTLYEAAVQHPFAEVRMAERVWQYHRQSSPGDTGAIPLLLREDFAGTAAVAAAWCDSHPERQALAVECDHKTIRAAQRRRPPDDYRDLHLVESDIMALRGPRVDTVAVLSFSIGYLHTRADLLAYLRHTRRNLRPHGTLLLDLFGGPGSETPGTQSRPVTPNDPTLPPFTYHWEQRRFDPLTRRIDCRIHFDLSNGATRKNAFRYDWRLWTPTELTDALIEAGFQQPTCWCDRYDPETNQSDGHYRPASNTHRTHARHDWVIYLSACRD
ncbi:MAG: class I SAM-dependent methyltransferase [Planctomycetota bacterium]